MNGSNRRRAIQLMAQGLPPIKSSCTGNILHMQLSGAICHGGDRGAGIHQYAVEALLDRHSSVATVLVEVDSNGGSVRAAKGIYTALRNHSGFKVVRASGQCDSAAMTILLAGDFRTADRGASFLAHQVSLDPQEGRWTAAKHAAAARRLRSVNDELTNLYASRTGRAPQLFRNEMANEKHMSASRARDLGFIHCLAGQERWINGRPYYSGDEPMNASDFQTAVMAAMRTSGKPFVIGHASFSKRFWRSDAGR